MSQIISVLLIYLFFIGLPFAMYALKWLSHRIFDAISHSWSHG